jgi:hypothetical protein
LIDDEGEKTKPTKRLLYVPEEIIMRAELRKVVEVAFVMETGVTTARFLEKQRKKRDKNEKPPDGTRNSNFFLLRYSYRAPASAARLIS